MIYVNVTGGLGNQMFQYAIARKYQIATGQKIVLNIHELKNFKLTRTYQLDGFRISDNTEVSDKQLPWYVHRRNYINKVLRKISPVSYLKIVSKLYNSLVWYKETDVELPQVRADKDIYIGGYWQSAYYFKEIDEIVRREFLGVKPPKAENCELYDCIKNSESICVTIRRGDYVTNETYRKKHFLCDNDYFIEGVRRIRKEIPNAVVFVFSDDVEWVKSNIDFGCRAFYETGNDDVWEKMRLMSACKHFVISNSTFSWWAQHLSDNQNKIVYAPSRWYPDGRKCDINERSWRYIEVKGK